MQSKTLENLRPPSLVSAFKQIASLWFGLLLLACIVFLWSPKHGLTMLWAVSVCLLPIMLQAKIAGKQQSVKVIEVALRGLGRAEAVKFLFSLILFAIVFKQADKINVPVFFMIYIATQVLSIIVISQALSSNR